MYDWGSCISVVMYKMNFEFDIRDHVVQKKLAVALLLLMAGGLWYGSQQVKTESAQVEIVPLVNYKVVKDEQKRSIKRTVDVVLAHRISAEELKKIAHQIKNMDKNSYERTFINYSLSEHPARSGLWASTHFNPDLEVKIWGLSKEQAEKLINVPSSANSENLVGTWLYIHHSAFDRKIELYRENNLLILKNIFPDGSSGKSEVVSEQLSGGLKIVEREDKNSGKYYMMINQDGDLEFWNQKESYDLAKKIP